MSFIRLALITLLVLVHVQLWVGDSGLPRVLDLQAQLDAQLATNDIARHRNDQLAAEVIDLKEGLEMVEEKARYDLGMVKPDEILVQWSVSTK
jgi:cell division protein FtsB